MSKSFDPTDQLPGIAGELIADMLRNLKCLCAALIDQGPAKTNGAMERINARITEGGQRLKGNRGDEWRMNMADTKFAIAMTLRVLAEELER